MLSIDSSIPEATSTYKEDDSKSLSSFPKELISEIFSHLDLRTFLGRICIVNKQCKELANDKTLLEKLKEKFPSQDRPHVVQDPINPDCTVAVVGVIEEISWDYSEEQMLILAYQKKGKKDP